MSELMFLIVGAVVGHLFTNNKNLNEKLNELKEKK